MPSPVHPPSAYQHAAHLPGERFQRPQQSKTVNLTLTIAPATLVITTTSLPDGQINVAYSTTLAATGGTTPYTWSLTSGTLPSGLSLNASTGAITGTPTVSVSALRSPSRRKIPAPSAVQDRQPHAHHCTRHARHLHHFTAQRPDQRCLQHHTRCYRWHHSLHLVADQRHLALRSLTQRFHRCHHRYTHRQRISTPLTFQAKDSSALSSPRPSTSRSPLHPPRSSSPPLHCPAARSTLPTAPHSLLPVAPLPTPGR